MKNLMIFVDPAKDFNPEHKTLVKVQIDNSLDLGWNPDDIFLVTNFPYNYRGVCAYEVDDDCYFPYFNRATKIPVIVRMFEEFNDSLMDDIIWFHDFDAFQLEPFPEIETNFAVALYYHRSRKKTKWNAGSFFFSRASYEFEAINNYMWANQVDEEDALAELIAQGIVKPDYLDIRYNVNIFDFFENCEKATKPILVAHFHPGKPRHMRMFNRVLPERLKIIFRSYSIDTQDKVA
jgi:hypothetical protein